MAYQNQLIKENSAPEFQNLQKNSMLRKTQSQPAKTQTLPKEKGKDKNKKSEDKDKHSRAKSVPSPIHSGTSQTGKAPMSPTAKDLPTDKLKKSGESGSPKPKRSLFDGFKNTLRSKKSHDSSKGSSSGQGDYASGSGHEDKPGASDKRGGGKQQTDSVDTTDSTTAAASAPPPVGASL